MASSAPKLMPLARLARGAFSSSSITRAHEATGTHLHRILGYSHVDRAITTGDYVKSEPFVVGGREWHLKIYPNGIDSEHRGFVSADLSLDLGTTKATYRVSILDRDGNPVHSRVVGPRQFNSRYSYFGGGEELPTSIRDLVATEELKRSAPFLLKDDCLDVRCDVATVELETEPCGEKKKKKKKWFMGLY